MQKIVPKNYLIITLKKQTKTTLQEIKEWAKLCYMLYNSVQKQNKKELSVSYKQN